MEISSKIKGPCTEKGFVTLLSKPSADSVHLTYERKHAYHQELLFIWQENLVPCLVSWSEEIFKDEPYIVCTPHFFV